MSTRRWLSKDPRDYQTTGRWARQSGPAVLHSRRRGTWPGLTIVSPLAYADNRPAALTHVEVAVDCDPRPASGLATEARPEGRRVAVRTISPSRVWGFTVSVN